MIFRQLFDHESSTYTYLLGDDRTGRAVLIDPVREHVDRDLGLVAELGLTLEYTLETHVHADHIAGGGVIRERVGSRTVMSARAGASCADVLVEDGDRMQVGDLVIEARLTPGHTNGCVSYVVPEHGMVFTGDTLLIRGCGRTDFQEGSSEGLYDSVNEKLFSLPDTTQVYPGHDYKGRTSTTIGEEKRHNPRLGGGRSRDEFVAIMAALDLAKPRKIDVAVPANLECGLRVPAAEPPPKREAWSPVARTGLGVPEVGAAWVRDNLRSLRVVDVREEDEYNGPLGHIPGSELVPMGTVESAMPSWKRDEPIVVLCRSGGRSGRVAAFLERQGFTRVASLRGGMLAYDRLPGVVSRPETDQPSACG